MEMYAIYLVILNKLCNLNVVLCISDIPVALCTTLALNARHSLHIN